MVGARESETPRAAATSTVDAAEIARFARLAESWWDPAGPSRPLHKLNPVRLHFLRDHLVRHFARSPSALKPFEGLRLLDAGCGGGLVSEPMARLGFSVAGIDAGAETIATARHHAQAVGLAIDYQATTIEALAATDARFDVVLALEIVEHVADLPGFIAAAAAVLAPGGLLVASTINRTTKAYLLAIIGAEYVLRWLPRGTHDWRKFIRPSELVGHLRRNGLRTTELSGVAYNPLTDSWTLSSDLDVNYMLCATPV